MQYDSAGKVGWTVKAGLEVQGFSDSQGAKIIIRSPTTARTAERLLVSTCVPYGFELSSKNKFAVFLQGDDLAQTTTADSKQRKACIKPLDSFGDYWRKEELGKAAAVAGVETWM